MNLSKFYNAPIPKDKTQEELEAIVTPRRLKTQVDRRVECAELLILGQSYNEIIVQMKCSTAFVASVAKRLKAAGLRRRFPKYESNVRSTQNRRKLFLFHNQYIFHAFTAVYEKPQGKYILF